MMKKFLFMIFISAFLLISCEENFSPKGEFQNEYALTCVIRGDTTLQVAALFSNYDVEGFDPEVYNGDPAYKGADIRLWYQDTVYVFKDSSVVNSNLPDSNLHFYYLDDFKPEGEGELMEIVAMLKNGKRLRANCFTPTRFYFDLEETSNTIPAVNTPTVNVFWKTQDNNSFYVGRIRVKYFEKVNGVNEEKWIDLPVRTIQDGGKTIPIYPTPSKQFSIAFQQSAINYALGKISEGNENKSDFTVSNLAKIEILSLDENLSRYYSSTLEDNNYTVRVNETDYSNVEGGFGIFGSLNRSTKKITLLPELIESFGYKVLYEN